MFNPKDSFNPEKGLPTKKNEKTKIDTAQKATSRLILLFFNTEKMKFPKITKGTSHDNDCHPKKPAIIFDFCSNDNPFHIPEIDDTLARS